MEENQKLSKSGLKLLSQYYFREKNAKWYLLVIAMSSLTLSFLSVYVTKQIRVLLTEYVGIKSLNNVFKQSEYILLLVVINIFVVVLLTRTSARLTSFRPPMLLR